MYCFNKLLFYWCFFFLNQTGLSHAHYMPNVAGKVPDNQNIDEDVESDLKKMCTLQ